MMGVDLSEKADGKKRQVILGGEKTSLTKNRKGLQCMSIKGADQPKREADKRRRGQ